MASSSSWTRSSSLRDFRQDDRYPGSHYYHCYASCFVLSLCCATYLLLFKPPKLPCQPLTFSPFLANHCLAMLPLCSAPLIALLVAGEVEDCSMVDRIMLGYHNISYLINASIYLVRVEDSALCLVFCSTLAALVSVIPVLCSRILRSLRGWVIYGTPLIVRFE